ncbi:MarR family winged helix-turn-helix transcriptional regulator [Devosia submarina]|uniref:MarR family winged helix-turn-helix transcriptional regulator n=1 Tax=Devosia submarina TaxID=1173082 RepID=UPI00130087C9|nr:MarR family transcriptional regulator [Devosia submarina]
MNYQSQPGLDELMRELTLELSQVQRWAAEQIGLNQADLLALVFVARAEGAVTPKALAEHLGLTTGAIAILINRLEAKGFIVRSPHPTDRRGVLLSLGDVAREKEFSDLRAKLFRLNAEVIDALSPEEAIVVRRFIEQVIVSTRGSLQKFRLEGADIAPGKNSSMRN